MFEQSGRTPHPGTVMEPNEPFHFHAERRLVQLTGRVARTLVELRAAVRGGPGACIFYHTHHILLSHHFETPVVYNDFAVRTGEALQESALPEELAGIDLMAFTTIRQLREAIAATIDGRLASSAGRPRECPRATNSISANRRVSSCRPALLPSMSRMLVLLALDHPHEDVVHLC